MPFDDSPEGEGESPAYMPDQILMRFTDTMLCFPQVFLLLVLAAFITPTVISIALIIGLTSWMEVARIIRAQIQYIKEQDFVQAAFALGASYAGKTACTITSGPGLALKTEMLALAVMAEIPLVVCVVQRGGPSTGLPTKVEQGDLLAALFGEPGDAPKIVLAAATTASMIWRSLRARARAARCCGTE